MKQIFEEPTVEVIDINIVDVIATSPNPDDLDIDLGGK